MIIDLVVNHTSIDHPWFKDARKSKKSRDRDYYVWSDKRPRDWKKGMVFPGVQQYEMLRDIREFLQWRKGDAMILAEANVFSG